MTQTRSAVGASRVSNRTGGSVTSLAQQPRRSKYSSASWSSICIQAVSAARREVCGPGFEETLVCFFAKDTTDVNEYAKT